jgi:hypothetical protein
VLLEAKDEIIRTLREQLDAERRANEENRRLLTALYTRTKTVLKGGPGLDLIRGDVSADTIYAQDGEKDTISCGGGTDTVYFDRGIDSVNPVNCENLNPQR